MGIALNVGKNQSSPFFYYHFSTEVIDDVDILNIVQISTTKFDQV
jgi:hypothetical protein